MSLKELHDHLVCARVAHRDQDYTLEATQLELAAYEANKEGLADTAKKCIDQSYRAYRDADEVTRRNQS